MVPLKIVPVEYSSDVKAFIDLPWKIYEGNSNWVPPLRSKLRRLLDPAKHPFWKSARRVLLLARRGSDVVGRIAGIVDDRYNRFHGEKMGAWGFFECRDDLEAADALYAAAEDWARKEGTTFLRGPLNPSSNYEVGTLIQGFEYPPVTMMTYNPPYYADLAESCGYRKEVDLLAFLAVESDTVTQRMERLVRRIKRNQNLSIHPMTKKEIHWQVPLARELYNVCLRDSYGFTPISYGESQELFHNLRRIGDPDLVFFVYYGDDPAGVAIILPDINPLLMRLNGRMGLSGLAKMILYRKEITGLRGMLFALKKEYRNLGLPLVCFDYLNRVARAKNYRYIELGWNLENNEAMTQLEKEGGAKLYKRYRIYRKSL